MGKKRKYRKSTLLPLNPLSLSSFSVRFCIVIGGSGGVLSPFPLACPFTSALHSSAPEFPNPAPPPPQPCSSNPLTPEESLSGTPRPAPLPGWRGVEIHPHVDWSLLLLRRRQASSQPHLGQVFCRATTWAFVGRRRRTYDRASK